MRKLVIFLNLAISILPVLGVTKVKFPNLLIPHDIKVSEKHLLILENYSVLVYSLKDYKMITKFGNKGEGPGEFMSYPMIKVYKNSIFVNDTNKVMWFSEAGELIKEQKTPALVRFHPVGKNYVADEIKHDTGIRKVMRNFMIYNSDFKKEKLIYMGFLRDMVQESKITKQDMQMVAPYVGLRIHKNNIFIADSGKGLNIEVYDQKGTKLYTINKEHEENKLTSEYRNKLMERYKKSKYWLENKRNFNYIFPKYFPPIKSFEVVDDKIYIITFKEIDNKNEILIFDLKGHTRGKDFVSVKNRQFAIKNNKVYSLLEKDEIWELHINNIQYATN